MGRVVVLRIESGTVESGFTVSLQVYRDNGLPILCGIGGTLPALSNLFGVYQSWHEVYNGLIVNFPRLSNITVDESIETHEATSSGVNACCMFSRRLREGMREKLRNRQDPYWAGIREHVLKQLRNTSDDEIRVLIQTDNHELWRLPWHEWDLLQEDFVRSRGVEVAFSHLEHSDSESNQVTRQGKVKIVALLGNVPALQQTVRTTIQSLKPQAEPQDATDLNDLLSKLREGCEILIFAGHGRTGSDGIGYIYYGDSRITVNSFADALRCAISRGLKLVFLCCCDGLGLVTDLRAQGVNIPVIIAMREDIAVEAAKEFFANFFRNYATKGQPLYTSFLQARQNLEHWEDTLPGTKRIPMLYQIPTVKPPSWQELIIRRRIWERPVGLFMLMSGLATVFLISTIIPSLQKFVSTVPPQPVVPTPFKPVGADIATRLSFGEKKLLPIEDRKNNSEFTKEKDLGIKAMAAQQYADAVIHFDNALEINRNSPELLIALNNARIYRDKAKAHTLAVVVPIGTNPNNALEMLRGFAQAQNEFNENLGSNKVRLKLLIANDDDSEKTAEEIANNLVNNPEILAVVGHWTSDVSLKAARVYARKKLVFIAPVSTTIKLTNSSEYGKYVYQTNINNTQGSIALADHMLQTWKKQKAAIFYANVTYGLELRSEFEKAVKNQGGEIVAQFNLSAPNFNAEESVAQAISNGAQVIFIAIDNKSRSKAWDVIRAKPNRIKLIGDLANLYSVDTLKQYKDAALGMVMAIPWHRKKNSKFAESAKSLWGGAEVNHITAISYDAVQALIEAMKRRNPTREGIKDALQNSNFSFPGATNDEQQFSSAGDRTLPPQLVEVQRTNPSSSGAGFDFVPIDSPGR